MLSGSFLRALWRDFHELAAKTIRAKTNGA
jgi:hypothetical protein